MKTTRITAEQDQQIIKLFEQGLGKRRIGVSLDLNEDLVGSRLRALGCKRPRTSVPMPTSDQLRQMYEVEGQSSVEIAAQFHVHPVSIQKRLRAAGIARRGVGREDIPIKEQILALWDIHHTAEQVCDELRVGMSTLYRLVEKYEIPSKPHLPMAGERNGRWKGGWEEYYGPNWERQRNATRRRDNYRCRRCGVTEEEMGRQCDVHHLKPFREFNNDYEKANALPNLISCCPECHTYVERNPTEPLPAEPDPSLRTFQCLTSKRLRSYRVNPQEVAKGYEAGEKVVDLMQRFEATASEIYRALRRAGVRPKRKNDVDWSEVRRLHNEGLSRQQIADRLDCSVLHLYKIIPGKQPFCERPEVVAQILELGRQGLGTRMIAKQTGAGRTQVKALLRSNGIGPAPQPSQPKLERVPNLHPCACGCGQQVDISTRRGDRKLGPHFIHGHHRRGQKLNVSSLFMR